jgi:hypothetical protein
MAARNPTHTDLAHWRSLKNDTILLSGRSARGPAVVRGPVLVQMVQGRFAGRACFVGRLAPRFAFHVGPSKSDFRVLDQGRKVDLFEPLALIARHGTIIEARVSR